MEPEAESGGTSPEFAPRIAFLTASTPPEPTPRVKRAPDLIAGVATSPAKVEAGRPFQLRITLAHSKRIPRLVQIHLESVSHSIRRIRALTQAEAAAAEIVERMPAMAEGAAEVAVTLYDDEGRTHRMVVGPIPVFRRNPVFVIFWPSMRSLRLSSGAARYDEGADVFRTETNFMFLNNSAQQVTLDPTGTRQTVDQNSNQISTGSVNFGRSDRLAGVRHVDRVVVDHDLPKRQHRVQQAQGQSVDGTALDFRKTDKFSPASQTTRRIIWPCALIQARTVRTPSPWCSW